MCPIFNKTSSVGWNLSKDIYYKNEDQPNNEPYNRRKKILDYNQWNIVLILRYLQSACKHHILDGSSPYSKIYGKGNAQM